MIYTVKTTRYVSFKMNITKKINPFSIEIDLLTIEWGEGWNIYGQNSFQSMM